MDLTNILNNSSFDESRSSESEDNHAKQKRQRLQTPSPILQPPSISTSPIRQQLRQQTDFLTATTSPNNYTLRKPTAVPERVIRTRQSTRASSLASLASLTANTGAKTGNKLKRKQTDDSVTTDKLADATLSKRVKKISKSNDKYQNNIPNGAIHIIDETPEEDEEEEEVEGEENSKSQQSKKDNKIKRNKAPNSSWSPEEDGKLVWTFSLEPTILHGCIITDILCYFSWILCCLPYRSKTSRNMQNF
jgi:hypothetical protein